MKRIITLLLLLLAVGSTQAQPMSGERWSARAGVNFSNVASGEFSSDFLTGFNVGVSYSYPVSNFIPIYIEGAIYFQKRGARDNGLLFEGELDSKFEKYELEVPLLLGYHVPLSNEWALRPVVGLYYSLALSGEIQVGDKSFDPYKEFPLRRLRDDSLQELQLLHRSDFGVRVGVSSLYKRYLLGFSYDVGFLNLYSRDFRDSGYEAIPGSFAINLGYIF